MQKASKRDKLKKSEFLGDVTVNDYANVSIGNRGGRLKKGALIKLSTKLKQLNIQEDDRAWDEKLDEPLSDSECDEPEDGAPVKAVSRRKKKTVLQIIDDGEEGKVYPMEVWHLISEYIAPEDVVTFAGICSTCRAVTRTAAFWFSLYKRNYKHVDSMPEILRPRCMVRRYGLRSLVIRSLYYTYPPFLVKSPAKSIPMSLLRMRCVDCWCKKANQSEQWLFSFKLKETKINVCNRRRLSDADEKPKLYDMLDDVQANVDENCKVLQILSSDYCPLPMLIGQVLTSVKLSMSQKCQFYHVHLQFNNGPGPYQSCHLSIDNVAKVRVLSWWHPSFPRSDPFNPNLYSNAMPDFDF